MSNFTVVVIGMPQVAQALAASGQFAAVEPVGSTSGLRDLLRSTRMTPGAADKVFLFSDATTVDTDHSLGYLIQQMTGMRARVIVVATSPAGEDLVAAVPSAGLIKGALRINTVLGAIGGMAVPVRPVAEEDNAVLDPSATAGPLAQPNAPTAPPTAQPSAPPSASANPFGEVTGNPFAAPAHEPAPAPVAEPVAAPVAAPADPAPSANPFASTAPAPSPTDAGPAAAATGGHPSPAAAANPFAAHVPAPAGTPFAPTQPTQASPFAPSPAAQTASPFAPAQPTQAPSPFAPAGPRPGTVTAPVSRAGVLEEPRPARRGYVITITSPKGGTGKSSMSLNLAAYLGLRTQGQRTVALIDANVQQADAGKYLNAWTPNIEELGKDASAIHPDRIQQHLLHKRELNLSVLLGPMTPDVAHPVYYNGKKYAQILEAMRPNYDYIIIDTPVAEYYHDMFREFALPCADFVLVTIAPNYTTLMNTDAWLRQVCSPKQSGGMGIDPRQVGVVLNRAEEEIGFAEEQVMHDLNEWRYLGAVPETKEWKKCNNEGKLVATMNYAELNEAFSNILFQATGEELLRTGPTNLTSASPAGFGAQLRAMLRKRSR